MNNLARCISTLLQLRRLLRWLIDFSQCEHPLHQTLSSLWDSIKSDLKTITFENIFLPDFIHHPILSRFLLLNNVRDREQTYLWSWSTLYRAQHDYKARVVLPDHLPEFLNRTINRSLSCYECLLSEIPNHGLNLALVSGDLPTLIKLALI